MDTRVPLQLTSLAILSPSNTPLYVHAFTGEGDTMRAYHLAHAAVDVIEERIVMTSSPSKPADSYLGLLFCMEDMAFYGFQTPTKLRFVLSVALVDAMIKDADIVAIFRAVHHLVLEAIHNPFLSLRSTFTAVPALALATKSGDAEENLTASSELTREESPRVARGRNEPTQGDMFATGPESISPDWLSRSTKFTAGVERLGTLLDGGRR